MSRAQRLKRAFNIDVEACQACSGAARIIACINDPVVIDTILPHLTEKAGPTDWPESRAPPAGLFGRHPELTVPLKTPRRIAAAGIRLAG